MHRDTLHTWLREFNVDFKEVLDDIPTLKSTQEITFPASTFRARQISEQPCALQGADILIVGRYVTQSKDIERAVRDFLELTPNMREDIDLFRVHTE